MVTPAPMSPYKNYLVEMLKTGRISGANSGVRPSPSFFERSFYKRPGVVSIYDSFFTFRFFDLVANPWIRTGPEPEPFHRTSLWSQLYGRFHFSYFSQHPWVREDAITKTLGRAILALALAPTAAMLWGLLLQVVNLARGLRSSAAEYVLNTAEWVFPLQALAFFSMIVLFSWEYVEFCAMKDIYILPGLLSFLSAFSLALARAEAGFMQRRPVRRWAALILLFSLLGLYLINDIMVVEQLWKERMAEF